MGLFQLLLFAPPCIILVYMFFWIVLDCNVMLFYKTLFGISIEKLRGQVVWITGTSSGIGRQLALCLAQHGVRLVLSARRKPLLEELHAECLRVSDGKLTAEDVLVLPMNMTNIDEHQKLFQTVLKHFGRLDVLVNNAARWQRERWESIDVKEDREIFELNVFSVMNLSRIAVRYFLHQTGGQGQLVVTSSVAGVHVLPFSAVYTGAKHALNAYMNTLRMEHPELAVSIFAPGPIDTGFIADEGDKIKYRKRMSAKRCAHLFAVAIANKLSFSWCSVFPVNVIMYAARYPRISKAIYSILGGEKMSKFAEGEM